MVFLNQLRLHPNERRKERHGNLCGIAAEKVTDPDTKRNRRRAESGKALPARSADVAAVGKVEFLGGKCHLGYGKITVMRVDIPGVLKRVEIHTIAVFPEVLVFDVTGVQA